MADASGVNTRTPIHLLRHAENQDDQARLEQDPTVVEVVDRLLAGNQMLLDHAATHGMDKLAVACLFGAFITFIADLMIQPLGLPVSPMVQAAGLIPSIALAATGVVRLTNASRRFARQTVLPMLARELFCLVPSQQHIEAAHQQMCRAGARLTAFVSAHDLSHAVAAVAAPGSNGPEAQARRAA